MREGFQLNPTEIAEQICRDLPTSRGWSLNAYPEHYARPDWDTGMMVVYDPVDRAVVVFVGTRAQAVAVMYAAREALGPE